MKRACRTAPPAHNSMIQGFGPHVKQVLLTKDWTDTAKESPARSGWKQPASACQMFCTTCSLPDLLPITSAQTLNGCPPTHPLCLAAPLAHGTKYNVDVAFRLSRQRHSREGHSDTPCYPFSAGAWRQKQRTVSGFVFRPLLKVDEQVDTIRKFIRTILKCVLFLEHSGAFWEEFCSLLDISVCPHKFWQDIYIFLTTPLPGS